LLASKSKDGIDEVLKLVQKLLKKNKSPRVFICNDRGQTIIDEGFDSKKDNDELAAFIAEFARNGNNLMSSVCDQDIQCIETRLYTKVVSIWYEKPFVLMMNLPDSSSKIISSNLSEPVREIFKLLQEELS